MKKITTMAMAANFAILTGCASIIDGGSSVVEVKSTPEGATVVVTDEAGSKVHKAETPTTISLARGAGYFKAKSYSIELTKTGYKSQTIELRSSMNGWYIGNILFGGLIGFLVVDPLTGAMWKLTPEKIDATLDQDAAKVTMDGGRTLNIVLLEDVPVAMRKDMVALK
ncbi:hypothetical protein [Chitinivorax sp. B]|uniref:hypothetical protein n=1 Tax=Chitinivorax sp. B TaxID=2502235 RepID=UPI0010F6580F|nr:hypothetical protein [Chitinivorax sp. B]